MASSNASLRQRKLNAGRKGGFEAVGARSRFDLFPTEDDGYTWRNFFGWAGRHETPHLVQVLFAFLMEMAGSFLVGAAVALAAWASVGLHPLLGGALVGVAYGLSYYIATRWVADGVFKRHLNGAVTLGYLLTGDIGLLGVATYTVAQYCGGLIAGGMVAGLIDGAPGTFPQATVPMPVTTAAQSSLTTVVCLELFCGAIIVFSLLINQFATDKEEPASDDPKVLSRYKKAATVAAMTTALLVMITFQYQVFTYSNVAYFGGFFGSVATNNSSYRSIGNLAAGSYHADTVFDSGAATALYLLMPYASGLLGAAFFWAFFMARLTDDSDIRNVKAPDTAVLIPEQSGGDVSRMHAASVQSAVSNLVSPFSNQAKRA